MTLSTFAQNYRLKITKDQCGDPIIAGKHGHIYEYGSDKLGVCITSPSGNVYRWNKIRKAFANAGMEITQNGDDEGCATFDSQNIAQSRVAIRCAQVKRKKQISPETMEAMIANLARARQVKQSISD